MPVKRKTIALALDGNSLAATDAATGLGVSEACVQGEDGAVWLRAAVPADWQDLTVRLQIVAADGACDESDPAAGGVAEMPIRAGVAVPGPLTVRLSGSDGAGVRRSADCRALSVRAGAVPAEPAPHLYPYAVRRITGSGGARVTQTENTAYNIDVSGTGGDMLESNYASGRGRANGNTTDHALYADAAEAAWAGGALETELRTGWMPLPACAYVSASAFAAPEDLSQVLSPGDRIMLTQGTVKYFTVAAVSAGGVTTVTVDGGVNYTLSNAAIASPCFSKAGFPAGFPGLSNWTATTALTVGSRPALYFYKIGHLVVVMMPGYINLGVVGNDQPVGTIPAGYEPPSGNATRFGAGAIVFLPSGMITIEPGTSGDAAGWMSPIVYVV